MAPRVSGGRYSRPAAARPAGCDSSSSAACSEAGWRSTIEGGDVPLQIDHPFDLRLLPCQTRLVPLSGSTASSTGTWNSYSTWNWCPGIRDRDPAPEPSVPSRKVDPAVGTRWSGSLCPDPPTPAGSARSTIVDQKVGPTGGEVMDIGPGGRVEHGPGVDPSPVVSKGGCR